MVNSLYKFAEVESKTASPATLHDAITDVLRKENSACYSAMEVYLIPPGHSGSRYFDQAYAIQVLLSYDKNGEERITKIMKDTPTLNERALWDSLQKVLRRAGFKMRHGRLVGLLEHKEDEPATDGAGNEQGQPDID